MYKLSDKDQLIPIFDKSNDNNNRQKIIPSYLLNGALYLVSKDFLLREKSFISEDTIAYKMSQEKSVDIDTSTDWDLALFYKKELSLEESFSYRCRWFYRFSSCRDAIES